MRAIKFRAFLKDTNEMVKVGAMDWDEEGNLLCLNYPKGKDYFGYEDDIALMQYTGFKDKDGREIYEGDIIKYRNNLYQVRWIFLGFYAHQINGRGFKELDEFVADTMDIEVVGNIYENPELLESSKG
nr:MAG TPA: YopX protein [Caudoviricetes sp.]